MHQSPSKLWMDYEMMVTWACLCEKSFFFSLLVVKALRRCKLFKFLSAMSKHPECSDIAAEEKT